MFYTTQVKSQGKEMRRDLDLGTSKRNWLVDHSALAGMWMLKISVRLFGNSQFKKDM